MSHPFPKRITLTRKQKFVLLFGIVFVIAAPFLWYWLFGWGTINVIDFSAEEVESVQISCSHLAELGTIYDSVEIQALINEANAMQNKGSPVKQFFHGIGMGGSVLYDYHFYLTDGKEFLLTFCSHAAGDPVSDKRVSCWYRFSPTEQQIFGPMCRGSMEKYFELFEKYTHHPLPGSQEYPHTPQP